MNEEFLEKNDEPESKRSGSNIVQLEMVYYRAYLRSIEQFIKREANELTKEVMSGGADEWDLATLADLINSYPRTLRSSLFVTIYARIESSLNSICQALGKKKEFRIQPYDLRGEGVIRSLNYLEKVAGVRLPEVAYKIREYGELRNCLAHAEGDLAKYKVNDKEARLRLERYVRGNEFLSLDNERIVLEAGFCDEVIANASCFFDNLYTVGYFSTKSDGSFEP